MTLLRYGKQKIVVMGAAAGLLLSLGLSAVPAQAAAIPAPSGVSETAATSSSLTVSLHPVGGGVEYRLWVAPTMLELNSEHLAKSDKNRSEVTSHSPKLTISHLTYRTGNLFYRVATIEGTTHRQLDVVRDGYLKPATPTGIKIVRTGGALSISWSGHASRYHVRQSTDAAGKHNATVVTVNEANGRHYTPYKLSSNVKYYYRVRALNGFIGSGYSSYVTGTATGTEQVVRVASYNLLTNASDGTKTSGNTIAPLSERLPKQVAVIKKANPGILAVQEGANWVGYPQGMGGTRQVDALAARLPAYTLAHTETPPSQHQYHRYGNYIFYKTSLFKALGTGGHWALGQNREGQYQLLQVRSTGKKLLVVTSHDLPTKGTSNNKLRENEISVLLSHAKALAKADGVANVVYPADYNSYLYPRYYSLDGPGKDMRDAGNNDAQASAVEHVDSTYNSSNRYLRTAPRGNLSIDHIYTSPSVAVRTFGVTVILSHGKFVGAIPSDHNLVWADTVVR